MVSALNNNMPETEQVNMDPQIVANHGLASRTELAFLDYAVTQGNCLERLTLLDSALPGFAGHYEFPLQSWPWFINQASLQMLHASACRIPALIHRAVRAEFAGDVRGCAAFYSLPEILSEIFLQSGMDLKQLIVRVDAMLTADGLKIMEINTGPNVGGWQVQWIEKQYRKHPQLAPFFASVDARTTNIPLEYMQHLVRQGRACLGRQDAPINVVLIIEPVGMRPELAGLLTEVFADALRALGERGALFFEFDFAQLRFERNAAFYRGERLAAVVSYRSTADAAPPTDLYRCFLSGAIAWPDNPFTPIIGDKRSLAILAKHQASALFTDEERGLIARHIAWSVPVTAGKVQFEGVSIELKTLLIERQRDFVVKVARGYAGQDVFVGRFQSAHDWRDAVERAFADGAWLAQQYCESLPFYGQAGERGYALHDVVWGVFSFGLEYGGCWLRLMGKNEGDGVINSAKGAMETVVYEVDE